MSILELYQNGTIKYLVDTGFMSLGKAVQLRYYDEFKSALKIGVTKTEAVGITADVCGVTPVTIWRAIHDVENAESSSSITKSILSQIG